MFMKVLVVGGAGYIGSHAVRGLLNSGYEVVVIDNLQTGHLNSLPERVKFYKQDIRNRERLFKIFEIENFDAVMHFAANSIVGESMSNPIKYYDNNVYGTQVLLEAMKAYDVKYIVFSSTAATYGEPTQIPITEDCITNPTNAYGETKLAMEKMMKWFNVAYNINYVSLRYFNVAGANNEEGIGEDHRHETHLIPLVLQVPLGERSSITIFGDDYDTKDGTCIRDYIHIIDLIDAHILALKYLVNGGKSDIFNLGSNEGYSVKEIIETARKVTGHPIPSKIGERRKGDPSILIASSQKAKSILGWQPKHTNIEEIIQSAWNWHKANPQGYKDSTSN